MSATLRGARVHLLTCGRAHAAGLSAALEPALGTTGSHLAGHQAIPATGADLLAALGQLSTQAEADIVLVAACAALDHRPRIDTIVADAVDQPLPGIGEATRAWLAGRDGVGGWLAPSGGGMLQEVVIVVVPDAAEHLAALWSELLGPLAARALESMDGDVTVEITAAGVDPSELVPAQPEGTQEAPGRPGVGVDSTMIGQGTPPEPEEDAPLPPWQRALDAYGAERKPEIWPTLPEVFERIAAARDVLDRAGERATVALPSGEQAVIFGFPDLQRPNSKVIMVREATPLPELVALHRHPRQVGTLVPGDDGLLPSADLLPDPLSERLTGRPTPRGGFLFALKGDAVLLERQGRVYQFDGRTEVDMGSPKQAYASLVLEWSQR